jgi:hypothetical protein
MNDATAELEDEGVVRADIHLDTLVVLGHTVLFHLEPCHVLSDVDTVRTPVLEKAKRVCTIREADRAVVLLIEFAMCLYHGIPKHHPHTAALVTQDRSAERRQA